MEHLQNDPDRAGGLVSDAQGEFVKEEPGGVFDPRSFRGGSNAPDTSGSAGDDHNDDGDEPPMDDPRMVGPDGEIDKTR